MMCLKFIFIMHHFKVWPSLADKRNMFVLDILIYPSKTVQEIGNNGYNADLQ